MVAFRHIKNHLIITLTATLLIVSSVASSFTPIDCDEFLAVYTDESYPELRSRLVKAIRNHSELSKAQKKKLQETIDALLFVDYFHTAPSFYKSLDSSALPNISSKYSQKSFESFQQAIGITRRLRKLTLSNYLRVHAAAMAHSEIAGQVRDYDVVVYGEQRYSLEQVKTIEKNPYLYLQVKKNESDHVVGVIEYASVAHANAEILRRISKVDSELSRQIKNFEGEYDGPGYRILTKKLVEALSQERIENFASNRERLGALNSESKILRYIDLVADFHRDMISIHPFPDGNGRTLRLLSFVHLLNKEGLPSSRLVNPDLDIEGTKSEWRRDVKLGVISMDRLVRDLISRLELGLNPELSSEWLHPNHMRLALFDLKYQGRKSKKLDFRQGEIDPAQFREFLRFLLKNKPNLLDKLVEAPEQTIQSITAEYVEFVAETRLFYKTESSKIEEIGLSFVTREFTEYFGKFVANDKPLWEAKKRLWYVDEILYRGMAVPTEGSWSQADLYDVFKSFNFVTVANNVNTRAVNFTHAELRRLALDSFQQYNQGLYEGTISQVAKEHTRELEGYDASYFYSTSLKEWVAKSFAMGAHAYTAWSQREYLKPEIQDQIGTRIVVGMYRGKKDVRSGRLRAFSPEYRDVYPRQVEVLGTGASDPDMICVLKVFDRGGEVVNTYLRNPEKPQEVLKISGDYNFDPTNYRPPAENKIVERKIL